jgi:hypothetical protein
MAMVGRRPKLRSGRFLSSEVGRYECDTLLVPASPNSHCPVVADGAVLVSGSANSASHGDADSDGDSSGPDSCRRSFLFSDNAGSDCPSGGITGTDRQCDGIPVRPESGRPFTATLFLVARCRAELPFTRRWQLG